MSDDRHHDPVPRSRSGFIGRRYERTGTEPVTAQSALRIRLLLSGIFAPLFVAGTVFFAIAWANAEPGDTFGPDGLRVATVICAVFAVFALLDLAVVLRRRGRERGSPPR
ncbi:hypothetical protein GCM10009716_34290 [Streptomyces sodiiphilus]|uniref:Integral membrane protein n=1 Tax=Streptomyces sodiiphilus TaxID=226217 RepID=A0ABP5AUG9_9ACTN